MRARSLPLAWRDDPFAALKRVQHASKLRTLMCQASSQRLPAERPGFASTISRTEYCAGRTLSGAERANEVLEHPKLQAAQEIAKVAVELAKRKVFPSAPLICALLDLLSCEPFSSVD